MHDELLYEQTMIHTIRMRLENGSADVVSVPAVDDIRISIQTDAEDAASFLTIDMKDGVLQIRQQTPIQQLIKARKRPSLHLTVAVPDTWKGALDARTLSGAIMADGVSGTDITLRSSSGTVEARQLNGICVTLKGGRKEVKAEHITCEKLRLSAGFGGVTALSCSFDQGRVLALTGDAYLDAADHMVCTRCASLTGSVTVQTHRPAVDAVLHAAKGRLRTQHVDLADGQPTIRMTTLTGRLIIVRPEGE